MPNDKKPTDATPQPTYSVSDCVITNTSAANEHTRAAVEALANACGKNADALAEIARALKGGNATMNAGIHIGDER